MVLGLLGESKHTRRYTRLQNFVREGADKAEIRVTLQNTGSEAFKPEKFGRSIIFQRFLHQTGRNSFLLLDDKGEVQCKDSLARSEGKRILHEFKINPGNPLIILQQEEAKEFLTHLTPTSLYTFFQMATLLKPCYEEYVAAERDLKAATTSAETKQRSLSEQKKVLEAKKAELREVQKSQERSLELRSLKIEYCWAQVQHSMKLKEELQDAIKKKEGAINRVCSEVRCKNTQIEDLNQNKSKLDAEVVRKEVKNSGEEAGLRTAEVNIC